jgi:photosystem II stability/assembly factor-like uncharacterized protein
MQAQSPALTPDIYKQLRWRYIGPTGNRIIAIAGIPGNPSVYFAGAASGGIFKTTDNGAHWDAVFDDQPVSSIGSLAVAPSDSNVVWAGTGEAFIRSNISIGNGIYRSTDAGKTWTHSGLDQTGRIGRLVIDPRNADVVFACALGHAYGPQADRGVYKTIDGGKSWQRVLFVDENTGCADIAIDPNNPRICLPACGSSRFTPGGAPAADQAAACSGQWMAASRGHGSTATACRNYRSAKFRRRSRAAIQTVSTH